MALITGILADYERKAMTTRQPVIEFHPSGPGVRAGASVLYASRVVSVEPAPSTGAWTADLELTSLISPEVWYDVVVKWLDEAGNFISQDRLPGRLYVDSAGPFSEKYRVVNAPWYAWVEPDVEAPPSGANQGDWVLDSISGDLYRVV
ncbi:hypothetical protein [Microbacterium oxydans]|uniref:hypothetical protein n=1 Tax=Microbacterium oxydans TaxID=82380 RepID=UPI00366E3956